MRSEDGTVESVKDFRLSEERIPNGSVDYPFVHPKRGAPRFRRERREMGKSVRRVLFIVLILVALAIWVSSRLIATSVGGALTTY
jgi:hypothetical protein